MYPFGSGYPNQQQQQNSNQGFVPPFGAGYPQQPYTAQPYPSQYPPTNHQSMYPNLPGYPPQPQNNTGYPTQQYYSPQQSAYPQQSPYPPNPHQMPQPKYSGYPTQTYSSPSSASHQNYPPQCYPQAYPANVFGASVNVSHAAASTAYPPFKGKGNPSVKESSGFNAVEDAKLLRKAMKGFGTDEEGLINVICRRTNEQRLMIEKEFKTNFGKDLIEDVKSETSGNFEKVLVALLTPIVDFYVKELHDAISGIGTDEDVLIEVLCSLSNYEINVIKEGYERIYHKSLEADLMSDTSGNFKRLLVSLCNAARDESGVVDIEAARADATELLRAGELRVGTDESTFNLIFCQRNYQQLKLVFEEYESICGHSITTAIENEFSGDIKDGLLAICQIVMDKPGFFASRLHKSMAGLGTNDRQLIRLIVTRSEIDMLDIKEAFQTKYDDSLRNWIKGDTSGHYKHALYVLIGENKS